MYRWCATYCWKALDKGYNFALNLILIWGLHTKLWAPKVAGVSTLGISGLPLGNLGTKWHLGAGPVAMHRVDYKEEGGGLSQVWAVVSLVSPCLLVACSCTKVLQLDANQLVIWFVQVCVSESLVNLPSPTSKFQHAPLPPKCYKLGSTPQLLFLPMFSPLDS
jgi:hypothetical protein